MGSTVKEASAQLSGSSLRSLTPESSERSDMACGLVLTASISSGVEGALTSSSSLQAVKEKVIANSAKLKREMNFFINKAINNMIE